MKIKVKIKSRNWLAVHSHGKVSAGAMKDHKKYNNKNFCRQKEQEDTGDSMSNDKTEFDTQKDPKPNDSKPIWKLVVEDMNARDNVGLKKYGTKLQAFNGRDSLQDAYEECLDLCVYLRQHQEERKVIVEFLKKISKTLPVSSEDFSYEAFTILDRLGES